MYFLTMWIDGGMCRIEQMEGLHVYAALWDTLNQKINTFYKVVSVVIALKSSKKQCLVIVKYIHS